MRRKHWMGMGLLSMFLGGSPAMAQFGPPAAGPGAPAAAAPGATAPAAAPAAQPGFFARACIALEECKRKLCKTPAGQMLNAMSAPAAAFTGGIIPPFCPVMPSAKDLAQPGVAGAADQAKKDALEAKARREAVKYLGTLDCRYYPEAEAALIAALRSDRIECVRLEAAISFANGCCCTRKVMAALEICVSGSDKDGNPAERSERVKDFAYMALSRCVACFQDAPKEVDVEPIEKEKPPVQPKEGGLTKEERDLIERARKTVAMYESKRQSTVTSVAVQAPLPKGQRSLYHIIRYGAEGTAPATTTVSRPATTQPVTQGPVMAPVPRELPQVRVMPMTTEPDTIEQTRVNVPTPDAEQPILPPMSEPTPVELPALMPEPMTTVVPMQEQQLMPPADPVKPETLTLTVAPSAPVMAPKPTVDPVGGLIDTLLTGNTPNERHHAIRSLSEHDWRNSPQIVAGLVKTARLDNDRAVRVNAIRHIASMKMSVPYVVDHLKYLQKDEDSWVAQESLTALQKLAAK